MLAGGDIVLEIGDAETGSPLVLAILHHGDGDSGNVGGTHELCDGGFNLCALVGREQGLLRGTDTGSTDRESENEDQQYGFAFSKEQVSK